MVQFVQYVISGWMKYAQIGYVENVDTGHQSPVRQRIYYKPKLIAKFIYFPRSFYFLWNAQSAVKKRYCQTYMTPTIVRIVIYGFQKDA